MKPTSFLTISILSAALVVAAVGARAAAVSIWSSSAASGQGADRPAALSATPVGPYHVPPDQLLEWLRVSTQNERLLIEDGSHLRGVRIGGKSNRGLHRTRGSGCGALEGLRPIRRGIDPGPRLSSRGVYSYFGRIATYSPTRPETELAAIRECKRGSAQVEFMGRSAPPPSEVELQAMRDHMGECIRALGTPVPERPSDNDLRGLLDGRAVDKEAYRRCQFAAADAFELDRLPG